jgi:hypothetical protein
MFFFDSLFFSMIETIVCLISKFKEKPKVMVLKKTSNMKMVTNLFENRSFLQPMRRLKGA